MKPGAIIPAHRVHVIYRQDYGSLLRHRRTGGDDEQPESSEVVNFVIDLSPS
jgi:hypothetical protein